MAVTSANLEFVSEDGHREYRAHFKVITDSELDGPITARNASGIPARYASYITTDPISGATIESDVGSRAGRPTARLVKHKDDRKVWEVVVPYSPEPFTLEDNDFDDPLLKPVDWSGSWQQMQKVAEQDNLGNAITNSAGDPFDPMPTMDDSRPVIRAVKNYAALNLGVWYDYRDAVNSDTFLGLTPRQVKVAQIAWRELFRSSGLPYYEVTFEFHVNPETWDFEILNQGFQRLNGGNHVLILDNNGHPVTTPRLLDANGNTTGNTPSYSTYRVYKERAFSVLGLPTTTVKT